MKAIFAAIVLGALAYVVWYGLISAGSSDPYIAIQMGYGNAKDGEIEMHTNVSVVMVAMDRNDRELNKIKTPDEWVAAHFKLTDSAGNPIRLDRQNNSKVIKPHQVIGTQEYFLVSKLKAGERYTFDYKPRYKEPDVFRYTFAAPAKADKPMTYNFMLVK